jgi:hypothetical protein
MIRLGLIAALMAFALALPAAASAEYFYTKTGAGKITREYVERHYGDTGVFAACRPQFRTFVTGFKYHRWICDWWASYTNQDGTELLCAGELRIIGLTPRGAYWPTVLHGERCWEA